MVQTCPICFVSFLFNWFCLQLRNVPKKPKHVTIERNSSPQNEAFANYSPSCHSKYTERKEFFFLKNCHMDIFHTMTVLYNRGLSGFTKKKKMYIYDYFAIFHVF